MKRGRRSRQEELRIVSGRRSSLSLSRSQPSAIRKGPDVFGICLSHISLSSSENSSTLESSSKNNQGCSFCRRRWCQCFVDRWWWRAEETGAFALSYAHRITVYVPGHRDLRPSAAYITSVCDRGYPCQFQRVCHRHLEYLDFSRKNSPILLIESDWFIRPLPHLNIHPLSFQS